MTISKIDIIMPTSLPNIASTTALLEIMIPKHPSSSYLSGADAKFFICNDALELFYKPAELLQSDSPAGSVNIYFSCKVSQTTKFNGRAVLIGLVYQVLGLLDLYYLLAHIEKCNHIFYIAENI